ncbi:PREDICTED: complement C1q tumor necrosis factor-related protein 8 [Lipotes vexillifer]|uniref:Complement C1q tumor necrosis factor-related protein 8 n=1 Tax=Lipotes vexillifer TaxID=118797 RepID=A0A340WXF8_LIPVE|nr:PREDICTED: complement C1q tumor necrosis factor-related protein 8 [Lipotes vexillifer]
MSDGGEWVGLPHVRPTVDISILKGEKDEAGVRGRSSRSRKEGPPGSRGLRGHKGQKGQVGPPGTLCQHAYVAFSVGWREGLHSTDALQAVPFDMELVDLDGAFDLASGPFLCAVPGVYFLNLNVHTWNYNETYLHITCNRWAAAMLYAQPSERSMMQTQSLLLALAEGDAVWVRMSQRDGDNAIYSERGDLYITFSCRTLSSSSSNATSSPQRQSFPEPCSPGLMPAEMEHQLHADAELNTGLWQEQDRPGPALLEMTQMKVSHQDIQEADPCSRHVVLDSPATLTGTQTHCMLQANLAGRGQESSPCLAASDKAWALSGSLCGLSSPVRYQGAEPSMLHWALRVQGRGPAPYTP